MASLKSWKDIYLLVLSSLITFSLVQSAKCREGFHQTEKGYCCWPTLCLKNQQFQLCTRDHGSDTCAQCADGLVNLDPINTRNWSYLFYVCHVPNCECAPEAILDNPLECNKTGIAICLCNREEWFYGGDPFNCQKAHENLKRSAMERGMELKLDGTVGNCPPGYFKALRGSSICSPHSKCPEGYSVEFPGTTVQDNVCKRDPSTSVATLPTWPTPPSSTSPDKVPRNANENNGLLTWVPVGLGVFTIIAVPVVLGLICWMKKRRKSDRTNNNGGVSVDPESGAIQPLIEEKEKKDLSASTGSQIQDCCIKAKDSIADRTHNNGGLSVDPESGSKQPLIEEKEKKDLSASTGSQIQDCYIKAKDSIAPSQKQEPLKGRDDQERSSKESEKKKDLLESGKTRTLNHYLYDEAMEPIELKGSSLDFSSLLDSGPKSDMNSRGNSILNILHIPVAQDSFRESLQTTSEDLGIGLSADSKNVNEIQKSGQKQGTEEKLVH